MSCQSSGMGMREQGESWVSPRLYLHFGCPSRATSLYKEDEPNVFAEPAILAQQLLPVLLQLLEKAPGSSPLRASALRWLAAAGPGVLRDLRYCKRCWSQGTVTGNLVSPSPRSALRGGPSCAHGSSFALSAGAAACGGMKALGCAKLHVAVNVLLARTQLVARALRVLGDSAAAVPGLGCGARELEQELVMVQGLLAQHGLAPAPSQSDVPEELGPPRLPSGAA